MAARPSRQKNKSAPPRSVRWGSISERTSRHHSAARAATGLPEALQAAIPGASRARSIEGGAELHVTGASGLLPRVVATAEKGGFTLADLSVAAPSLETVFITLTGKELRE